MNYYRQNFGYGTVGSLLASDATNLVMNSGHNFTVDDSKYFKLIIWDKTSHPSPADDPNLEIVTAHYAGSLNNYTISRAEEGTTAVAHAVGASCAMTITAGSIQDPTTGSQTFTSTGTTAWVCPADVYFVFITALAGGGGGGSGNASFGGGGGGGSGAYVLNKLYPVTPGTSYSITINAGGAGGTSGGSGSAGGSVVFDALTIPGGSCGVGGNSSSSGAPGGAGGVLQYFPGAAGSNGGSSVGGGGGAAPHDGIPGAGTGYNSQGGDATGHGNGGGGCGRNSNGKRGGNGKNGFLSLSW